MADILHYCNTKSKLVDRNASAAKFFELDHALDQASTLCFVLNGVFGHRNRLVLFADRGSLYEYPELVDTLTTAMAAATTAKIAVLPAWTMASETASVKRA